MEKTLLEIAAFWVGFNAVVFGLLVTRRSRPRIRRALYRWASGGEAPNRPSQQVHSLVWSYRHHR